MADMSFSELRLLHERVTGDLDCIIMKPGSATIKTI